MDFTPIFRGELSRMDDTMDYEDIVVMKTKTSMYEYVMFSCDISLTPEFFAALNFALSSLSLHAQHP